jgi:hypothetical protein
MHAVGLIVPGMMRRLLPVLSFACILASCSKHALQGGWREEGAQAPRVLEFDPNSSRLMVHAHGRADGGHEHLDGMYRLDGVTIHVEWVDGAASVAWDGSVQGDRMELKGKDGASVAFVRGGSAH